MRSTGSKVSVFEVSCWQPHRLCISVFPYLMRPGRLSLLLVGLAVLGCEEEPPVPWHNHAPLIPHVSGPSETWVGIPTSFDVTVYDPDGHSVAVFLAWGDGDTTQYPDFVASGAAVMFEHTWRRADTFAVTARCYDIYDPKEPLFSGWSNSLQVVVRSSGVR